MSTYLPKTQDLFKLREYFTSGKYSKDYTLRWSLLIFNGNCSSCNTHSIKVDDIDFSRAHFLNHQDLSKQVEMQTIVPCQKCKKLSFQMTLIVPKNATSPPEAMDQILAEVLNYITEGNEIFTLSLPMTDLEWLMFLENFKGAMIVNGGLGRVIFNIEYFETLTTTDLHQKFGHCSDCQNIWLDIDNLEIFEVIEVANRKDGKISVKAIATCPLCSRNTFTTHLSIEK